MNLYLIGCAASSEPDPRYFGALQKGAGQRARPTDTCWWTPSWHNSAATTAAALRHHYLQHIPAPCCRSVLLCCTTSPSATPVRTQHVSMETERSVSLIKPSALDTWRWSPIGLSAAMQMLAAVLNRTWQRLSFGNDAKSSHEIPLPAVQVIRPQTQLDKTARPQ